MSFKDRVKLKTRVIIETGSMSGRDLAEITADGKYGPVAAPGDNCLLECGGEIVAAGKLVKKGGSIKFKILETGEVR